MMNTYEALIEDKFKNRIFSGIENYPVSDKLFKFQKTIVEWALKKGRACIFADCGLGKTPMQLQWAKAVHEYTNKPVLILAPLAVSAQTVREGKKFDVEVKHCRNKDDVINGVNITNYEALDKFDTDIFVGIVLDESSILKSYMGKTKQEIFKRFCNTEYRLACTATPAPNDLNELLNHAEFLGIMRSGEALTIWFSNDTGEAGKMRLKKHAEKSFWEWVASWAVCMSKPSDIGYSDDGYNLPELTETNCIVTAKRDVDEESCLLFRAEEINATAMHKEKRRTLEERMNKTLDIVNATDKQVVVWCETNDEAEYLKKKLGDQCREVHGSQKTEYKEQSAIDFIDGKFRVLVSKPKIFGYGLNFQNCTECVFASLSYSFESYYQAVRRFWRFGQKLPVHVYKVVSDTEYNILKALTDKGSQKDDMQRSMSSIIKDIQTANLSGNYYKPKTDKEDFNFPEWVTEDNRYVEMQ